MKMLAETGGAVDLISCEMCGIDLDLAVLYCDVSWCGYILSCIATL